MVLILVSTQCIPVAKNWDKSISYGYCLNWTPVLIAIAAPGIALDVAIWSIPIPQVWNLQIDKTQKISLTLLFSLGMLDIIVAIIRVVTVININFSDLTYSGVDAAVWSSAEPTIAITVACGMCCKPVLDNVSLKLPKSLIEPLTNSFRSRSQGISSYGELDKDTDITTSLTKPEFSVASGLVTTTTTTATGHLQGEVELPPYGVNVQKEVSVNHMAL